MNAVKRCCSPWSEVKVELLFRFVVTRCVSMIFLLGQESRSGGPDTDMPASSGVLGQGAALPLVSEEGYSEEDDIGEHF